MPRTKFAKPTEPYKAKLTRDLNLCRGFLLATGWDFDSLDGMSTQDTHSEFVHRLGDILFESDFSNDLPRFEPDSIQEILENVDPVETVVNFLEFQNS